ncbi:MAG: hypothetical protein ACOYLB_16530, partial [Phototrophicaceae bacterium]
RYRRALELGAGWTRYPIYWNGVERTPNQYDWSGYDRLLTADHRAGLQTNAILLATPPFYQAGGSVVGLYEPIFSNGSDTPTPNASLNPNNVWAQWVFATVNRYKPNGILSQTVPNVGIRVWEVWNEPDLDLFWSGTQADYARLLKVAYLVIKQADPSATVMFGGLAYGNPDTEDWLDAVLQLYANDPTAPVNQWYMDAIGIHSYVEARRTALIIARMRQTLERYALSKPIWLNESGIPVWDDYPGPTHAVDNPIERRWRGTQQQQANFVLQSSAYAFAAGAEKVFFHQLYDDCGNDSRYDAFGLYRNPRGADCFGDHPQADTPRPSAAAFRLLARFFGNGNFTDGQIIRRPDGSVFIEFMRPSSSERVTVLWNELASDNTITWVADSLNATLYSYTGEQFTLSPTEGEYRVTLPPAVLNDDPLRVPSQTTLIGGTTFIMVENVIATQQLADADTNTGANTLSTVVTPRAPLPSQVGSILEPSLSTASLQPLQDIAPPITGMEALPPTSPTVFRVGWSGADNGGIARYLVWVQVNGGEWAPWLETAQTSAQYSGTVGNTVAFAVWAVDNAGNWSLNTTLQPQAFTQITQPP